MLSYSAYFQVQTKSRGLFFFLEYKGAHREEITILVESLVSLSLLSFLHSPRIIAITLLRLLNIEVHC